jgi:signal recognition particle GTPase
MQQFEKLGPLKQIMNLIPGALLKITQSGNY